MAWHEIVSREQETIAAVEEVLKSRKYAAIFAISSILFFIVLYFLTLATTTEHSMRIFIEMNGANYAAFSFLSLAAIALLFGLYSALLVHKTQLRAKSKASGAFGLTGFIGSVFSAGCPMCGAYLFGLLGMPLALFFMPFKGIELRVLTIILLMASIYFVAKSIKKCENCG